MQTVLNLPASRVVALAAVAAFVAWLPAVVWVHASADESGFLMIAAQWRDGSSVYGDYWVDRPPLLLLIFVLAAEGGGVVALRLLGAVAVLASVVLAGLVGHQVSPARPAAPIAAAITAAVFMATPLFGRGVVNGEVLAVPFVLATLVALLAARRRTQLSSRSVLWLVAGATAASAALVKQNFVEGFLVAAAMLAGPAVRGQRVRLAAAFALGAGGVSALLLALAWCRGTTPTDLWEAVVMFRFDASRVVGASASAATPVRAVRLLLAGVLSGAIPLLILAVRQLIRSPDLESRDLRIPGAVLVCWEGLSVVLGGSYWLHYLMGLVPGLVLVVALATAGSRQEIRRDQRARLGLLAYSAVLTVGSLVWVALLPPPNNEEVSDYLNAHEKPGDTALVAFGKPDILYGAGMSSPYPLMWSLPVRVLDPRLAQLGSVLSSPDRPTWLIASPDGLQGWGLDPSPEVLQDFARHYQRVAEFDGVVVYLTRAREAPIGGAS